jgi:hypothetical protein
LVTRFYIIENFHKKICLYVLSILLIGLGYIFLLPPFEGFDETAHFSRLLDHYNDLNSNEKFLDINKAIVDYSGPVPYSSGWPSYDDRNVYYKFFLKKENLARYVKEYRESPFTPGLEKSTQENWQYQHPPLFYSIFSSLFALVKERSLLTQVNFFRVACFLLAIFSLIICLFYSARDNKNREKYFFGFLLYPILYPMFFLEFARIGNDSFVLLINSIISAILMLLFLNKDNKILILLLGMLVGFGLLIKAFFLSIAVSISLFLIFRGADLKKGIRAFLFFIAPVLLIGLSYYIYKFYINGDLGIGYEALKLSRNEGFIHGLNENFTWAAFFRGLAVPFITFIWTGSWSLVQMPSFLYLPMIIGSIWLVSSYVSIIKATPMDDYNGVIVLMLTVIYACLIFHLITQISLNGLGTTGGWYIHIMMPWIAPALGFAASSQFVGNKKILLSCLLIYSFIFHLTAIWFYMTLYGGCSEKTSTKAFYFNSDFYCISSVKKIFENLSVLNYPIISTFFLVAGFLILFKLVYKEFSDNT